MLLQPGGFRTPASCRTSPAAEQDAYAYAVHKVLAWTETLDEATHQRPAAAIDALAEIGPH